MFAQKLSSCSGDGSAYESCCHPLRICETFVKLVALVSSQSYVRCVLCKFALLDHMSLLRKTRKWYRSVRPQTTIKHDFARHFKSKLAVWLQLRAFCGWQETGRRRRNIVETRSVFVVEPASARDHNAGALFSLSQLSSIVEPRKCVRPKVEQLQW